MNRSLRRAHALAIPALAGVSLLVGIAALAVRPQRAILSGGLSPGIEGIARSEPAVPGMSVSERSKDGLVLVVERTASDQRLRVTADSAFSLSDCLIYAVAAAASDTEKRDRFERARLLGVVRPGTSEVLALRDEERFAFAYGLIERATVLEIEIPQTRELR